MDGDDLAAAAAAPALDPICPPPSQELNASVPALPAENAASPVGESLAVDPLVAAAAGYGEQVSFDDEKVPVPAECILQEPAVAAEHVLSAAEAVLEEAASAAVDEDENPVGGDANLVAVSDITQGDLFDGGAYVSQASLGVGGDVVAEIDDLVGEGTAVSDGMEAMLTNPNIVLGGAGHGEAPDGEGDRSDEDAKAGADDMVATEILGVPRDYDPADVPEEDAGVGVQLFVALDDSSNASLIDDGSYMVSVGGGDRFDDQIGEEVGGDTHDDADVAALGHDVQDDGPLMDKNVAVSSDPEDAQDGNGAWMDAVAKTALNDMEADFARAGDDVAEEGRNKDTLDPTRNDEEVATADNAVTHEVRQMDAVHVSTDDIKDIHVGRVSLPGDDKVEEEVAAAPDDYEEGTQVNTLAPTGNDPEEEGVATAGDASTGEGRQTDAIFMCRDVNEDNATGTAAVDAICDDIDAQVDTVGLIGDDNVERESPDDVHVDGEGMQKDVVSGIGDEDKEEDMADQNINEEPDSFPEEAEVDMVGNDIPEEEATPIDEDDDEPPLTRKAGGRPKRGRPSSKAQVVVKPPVKKKDDEEVCFICFDGGELVVCDRRGCPKAYHPSCVNRDDDFFKSKGRWNCGWHICSNCQKPARHMCYTCTFSLCKGCIKETKFVPVRGTKGFCETCMNTVMLIENKEEATDQMDVDFDDKSGWWYLFKDYWLDLKAKLSLTFEEISAARHQNNGSALVTHDNNLTELPDTNDEEANSDSSSGRHLEKGRGRKRLKRAAKEVSLKRNESSKKSSKRGLSGGRDAKNSTGTKVRKLSKRASSSKESESVGTSTSSAEEPSWASKELLDFVALMRNGDKSVMSQHEVHTLLLAYIKRENLRDPHRKSQIVCDPLLHRLFGKARVGHFEMLKLLESHFLMSEVSPIDIDGNHGGVVDPDPSQDADGNSEASVVMSSEKKRKSRKYGHRALQTNLDDYAAIDNHNISLIYLRRNLMEELIGDVETFDEKVVGSFVRIRISGTGQRQDIYRLVQIVGTGTAAEPYKCGKKTTDITLEILNLDKKEVITIDITSNQEFTEEECKRLRQSIKCGFIQRLTVGELQEKSRILQTVKVNDWIENEKMRLGHLRDRASDMGHRKELRECVEKLHILSTPEERARRLNEEPEIHADPTMDPDYESPEEQEQDAERSSSFSKSRGSFVRKDSNPVSPGKGEGWNAAPRDSKTNWESSRNTWGESSAHLDSPLGRRSTFSSQGENAGYTGKSESPNFGANAVKIEAAPRALSGVSSEALAANLGSGVTPASQPTINESEKVWQYMDPSNKVQGPFSIVQLRKWNNSGYFPPSLKIWKSGENQDDSILLADALVGKFEKDLPPWEPPVGSSSHIDKTYLRSNSDAGARSRSDSLVEIKAGEQTPKSAAPNRSQSFLGSVGQGHDYDATSPGSNMTQSGAGYHQMQNSHVAYAGQQATVSADIANLHRNDSKLGDDSSHGRMKSLNEDHGPVGAQPAVAQLNTRQLEDARNQSTGASSVMPSQLMSTPSGGDSQTSGWAMPAQVANTSGQVQGAGNMNWGAALQGNANMGWDMTGQTNVNMSWGAPAQGAVGYNMGLTMPAQSNAVPNMGWVTPNPGNTNMNVVWAAAQGQGTPNAAAMMGAQMQGVAMAPWGAVAQGNANSYPAWGSQVGNNVGWSAPVQGNPGTNPVNGTGQGNNNMNWSSPNGNSSWNNQQDINGGDSGGRSWRPQSGSDGGSRGYRRGGGGGGRFCYSFMDTGACRKGDQCGYLHSKPDDGFPSRHDRRFGSQSSSNARPQYDRQHERNHQQFDRQPSGNERHHDRDNNRNDDKQADRSESRERQ